MIKDFKKCCDTSDWGQNYTLIFNKCQLKNNVTYPYGVGGDTQLQSYRTGPGISDTRCEEYFQWLKSDLSEALVQGCLKYS